MEDCIFCKIVEGTIPSEMVFEDENAVVFKDLYPKFRVHLLVVPREHLDSIAHSKDEQQMMLGGLILTCRKAAEKLGLTGYKLMVNVGKNGGQEIFHLHIHLTAN